MKKYAVFALSIVLAVSFAAGQVTPELQEKLQNKPSTEKVDVIILTKRAPNQSNIEEIRGAGGNVSHTFDLIDGVAVSLPKVAVQNMANRAFVRQIQPDMQMQTVLDSSVQHINATEVWDQNQTGNGVNVAVVDTGIDDNNSLLDVEKQISFTGTGTDDGHGHGTHVAGVIASQDENYRGVAYNSDLFDVKVLDENGTGSASDVIEGMEWAVKNDADVISLSLGAQVDNCDGTSAVADAVNKASAAGVAVVVAAGNGGPDNQTIATPGCAERGITVGSVGPDNQVSDFSSRGPTADGRTKPDVVAPGEQITSTWIDGSFQAKTGTSMATPHVSGVAAMLLSENSSLSPAEVKNITEYTAEDLGYAANAQGAGLVDAYAAYQAAAGNTTEKNTTENTTVDYSPSVQLLEPVDGATGVNDTDDNESIDVNLAFNISDRNSESLNGTVYMLNDTAVRRFVNTSTGKYSVHLENLTSGTTYSWHVSATDGENRTESQVYEFTTAAVENTTNETKNRTNQTLPPGLREKDDLPPAFERGLPQVGIPPWSPAYGLKKAMEDVSLALTFDPERKAELRMKFAERRLAEAQLLAKRNRTEEAKEFVRNYQQQMKQTRDIVERSGLNVSEKLGKKLNQPDKAEKVLNELVKEKRGQTEAPGRSQKPEQPGQTQGRPDAAGKPGKAEAPESRGQSETPGNTGKQKQERPEKPGSAERQGNTGEKPQKPSGQPENGEGAQAEAGASAGANKSVQKGPAKGKAGAQAGANASADTGGDKAKKSRKPGESQTPKSPEKEVQGANDSGKMTDQEQQKESQSQRPGNQQSGNDDERGGGPPGASNSPRGPVGSFFSSVTSLLP